MLNNIVIENFENIKNKQFKIDFDDTQVDSELIDIKKITTDLVEGRKYTPFSLLFHVNTHVLFEQGTYLLSHQELGELQVFLVPVSDNNDGFQYEAVFT